MSSPPTNPTTPLVAVLPRKIVVRLAVANFVLAIFVLVVVVALGLFWPETLANPVGRFLLLVLIALNFAVFFFVFYPQDVTLTNFVLGVRLIGPLAVFFIVLYALWQWMPEPFPAQLRYFALLLAPNRTVSNLRVHVTNPVEFKDYHVIYGSNGSVKGVLVKFPANRVEPIPATISVPGTSLTVSQLFERGLDDGVISFPDGQESPD